VPTDFSDTSDAALEAARDFAAAHGASLHLLHVFEDIYAATAFAPEVYGVVPLEVRQSALEAARKALAARILPDDEARFRVTTEIVTGNPGRSIVEQAVVLGADLIVMGTHGRSGVVHLLLGSVTEKVIRTAPCPVLTVRRSYTGEAARPKEHVASV
jgi:nucleotide-binding universal stress UspA family protein